jgi:glyoxylase-like metal-dependent hydrolase (beta-lactamase superfamily II)
MIDRRQLLTGVVGGLLGSLVIPRRVAASQIVASQTGTGQPGRVQLNERLSLLAGGGTNVLALSTADGLMLVDAGSPAFADQLMTDLKQVSPNGRVRTVFNTHWHPENTGANDILRQGGATIVAHENTRLWMATPTWMPAKDRYRQPRPRTAHPTETFYVDGSITAGGERVDYGYLLEAHTSGDIYVFFRDANVLAVGDVAAPVQDPVLDYFTGAWIGGRVDALNRLVELANDATRIVPGSGSVITRADLRAERDLMKTIYDRTVDRVREGDSEEDMLDAGVLKGLPRTFKDPKGFIHAVHKGLWAHHNKLNANVV